MMKTRRHSLAMRPVTAPPQIWTTRSRFESLLERLGDVVTRMEATEDLAFVDADADDDEAGDDDDDDYAARQQPCGH